MTFIAIILVLLALFGVFIVVRKWNEIAFGWRAFFIVMVLLCGYNMFRHWTNTPSSLGRECCECYKSAEKINNSTSKGNKMDDCMSLTRTNQDALVQMGVDKDWDEGKVQQAKKEFDNAYFNCK